MGVNGHWYVELEKQAYWRGQQHTYVNRYIMSGAQPSATDATSVITALHGIEDTVMPHQATGSGVGFVQGRAYPSGKGSYYAFVNYNISKAPTTATGFTGPTTAYTSLAFGGVLENSVVVETRLNALSSTGKPIFLRKYLRGFLPNTAEDNTATPIIAADLAKINTAVAPWWTGMGTSNWVVIGSSGAQAASAPAALPYVGNRQVPKGRKKKKVTPSLLNVGADLARLRAALTDIPDL